MARGKERKRTREQGRRKLGKKCKMKICYKIEKKKNMSLTEAQRITQQINQCHHTEFSLVARFNEGENQGAYAFTTPGKENFVLKWHHCPDWLGRLERARLVTSRLKDLGGLVPTYVLLGRL